MFSILLFNVVHFYSDGAIDVAHWLVSITYPCPAASNQSMGFVMYNPTKFVVFYENQAKLENLYSPTDKAYDYHILARQEIIT
jgi:hypothetical protein